MIAVEGTAIIAGGGRLLGGVALIAGQALSRKLLFRWKVFRRVRRKVDFSCDWRAYRKWLKTISVDELSAPVEDVQGILAKRLDEAMSDASTGWDSSDGHLSRAIVLVEMTYPAIAASIGATDQVELTENWAQQRNSVVRASLRQLIGPGAALNPEDLAKVLTQWSKARREVRLQAFEIEESRLTAYFGEIRTPEVPAGQVRVLIGDFGSGKSETAETWHRNSITEYAEMELAPLPVWLNAHELPGQPIEIAVERQFGSTWREGRGAAVVIDGLDEVDAAAAQRLLESARIFARSYANLHVLLTARPGILTPTKEEELRTQPLSEESAFALIEQTGAKSPELLRWTSTIRSTVTRPFFALAAGAMLRRKLAPRGEADLIRSLVESALESGTERSAVTSESTSSALQRLAIALTRGKENELSFGDRQILRSSRLIADGPDLTVKFALPIFQHWFAAQAILTNNVPTEEVVHSSRSFNRWRWAAAVALNSAPNHESIDHLMTIWVSGNPGAAAWILTEAYGDAGQLRTVEDGSLDPETSGARLLRALRVWADALGNLADGLLPFPMQQGPVNLGVTVSGSQIDVAFSLLPAATDHVVEIPPGVHPLMSSSDETWLPWRFGVAPKGDAWPWMMVRNQIAGATSKKLSRDPNLGSPDGIWAQERRYDLARALAGKPSLFHGSISAADVRRLATQTLDIVEHSLTAQVYIAGYGTYVGAELMSLVDYIDGSPLDQIFSRLPDANVPHPPNGWIWELYTPDKLLEFEVEVYSDACVAYDEALAHSFSSIGWALSSSALAPFGVVLEVVRDTESDFMSNAPHLTAMRVPLSLMADVVSEGVVIACSKSGRAVVLEAEAVGGHYGGRYAKWSEMIIARLTAEGREVSGGVGWSSSLADDMKEVRPASGVAASWLWGDLRSIGLGDGTYPQIV